MFSLEFSLMVFHVFLLLRPIQVTAIAGFHMVPVSVIEQPLSMNDTTAIYIVARLQINLNLTMAFLSSLVRLFKEATFIFPWMYILRTFWGQKCSLLILSRTLVEWLRWCENKEAFHFNSSCDSSNNQERTTLSILKDIKANLQKHLSIVSFHSMALLCSCLLPLQVVIGHLFFSENWAFNKIIWLSLPRITLCF